jgi:hypothetical protein
MVTQATFSRCQWTVNSRACSFALQVAAAEGKLSASVLDCLTAVQFVVRVRDDIDDAHVYTKKVVYIDGLCFFNCAGGKQVKVTTNQHEVGLTNLALQQFELSLTRNEAKPHSSVKRPDENYLLVDIPNQHNLKGDMWSSVVTQTVTVQRPEQQRYRVFSPTMLR